MPDYVKNILTIKGSKNNVKQIFKSIEKLEKLDGKPHIRSIDFNKIIPMPDYIFKGDLGDKEMEIYGKNNWYDWSKENWGTKWNACGTTPVEFFDEPDGAYDDFKGTITFETPWACPYPIIKELSTKNPKETFEIVYADEFIGHNCGTYIFKEGKEIDKVEFEKCTEESIRFAKEVWDEE